jgi:hypothetical protein
VARKNAALQHKESKQKTDNPKTKNNEMLQNVTERFQFAFPIGPANRAWM